MRLGSQDDDVFDLSPDFQGSFFILGGFRSIASRTGSNCLKSPRKIVIGRLPEIAEPPEGSGQILEHFSSIYTNQHPAADRSC